LSIGASAEFGLVRDVLQLLRGSAC